MTDVRGADPSDYRRLDSRLHLAIAELVGSPSLVPLVAENRMRVNRLLDRIPLLSRNIAHSDEQHEAIVIAILAGDPDARRRRCATHVAGIGGAAARLSRLARACVFAARHAVQRRNSAHARGYLTVRWCPTYAAHYQTCCA